MTPPLRLARWLEAEKPRILRELADWVAIPSVSADPARADDVRRSAEAAASLMAAAGLDGVRLLETSSHPAAYGEWLGAGDGAPTVLVYGHHDVQPTDPDSAWSSAPFEATVHDDEVRGRGTVDDKGQVLFQLAAVRGLLAEEGRLPVNLKVLVEGAEEVGSPGFEDLLVRHADLLACDTVVVSDTTMLAPGTPSTCVGMRGVAVFRLSVRTAAADLHSGLFGGAVPNAAHVAAALVAALHDDDGRVTIPGFYDDVRPLSGEERQSVDAAPFDPEAFMATAGVSALSGERGWSTLQRIWARPTAEVVGLTSAATGAAMRNVVPATAEIGLTFRLVPDQRPDRLAGALREWLDDRLPAGATVEVTPGGAVAPMLTPVDHPYMGALTTAIERVWGRPPLFTREGGSGPEEPLARVLGVPLLFLGVGLPDDRFHAPDERLRLDQLWRGVLAAAELLHELAAVGRVRP